MLIQANNILTVKSLETVIYVLELRLEVYKDKENEAKK